MSIKKSYVELIQFLEAHKDEEVSSILDEVTSMCTSKKQNSTYMTDADGNIIAIFCYYHKQWELVEDVPFGSKANSSTGYNTMCKVGTSMWTKKQRTSKKMKEELLSNVANGSIQPADIAQHQEEIEHYRTLMDTTDMPNGVTIEYIKENYLVQ